MCIHIYIYIYTHTHSLLYLVMLTYLEIALRAGAHRRVHGALHRAPLHVQGHDLPLAGPRHVWKQQLCRVRLDI